MTKANIILGGSFGAVVLLLFGWIYVTTQPPTVTNFEECVKIGYPVLKSDQGESYCQTSDNRNFINTSIQPDATNTQNTSTTSLQSNKIIIDNLKPGTAITSPLKITGQAKGNWFFESSFPIFLKDQDGQDVTIVIAQAQGDWMTTDFVPFEATLNFKVASDTTGTLIFRKDNPSGLPEYDDELSIPVVIKK